MNKLTLKPGKYWIGDPCYVYPDNKWLTFCDELHTPEKLLSARSEIVFIQGFHCFSTAYGDGVYNLYEYENIVGELGVDAGLLSIIPMSLVNKWPEGKTNSHLGIIVTIKEKTEVVLVGRGNVEFGDYKIFTDGSDMDDEDEYNNDYEDEDANNDEE